MYQLGIPVFIYDPKNTGIVLSLYDEINEEEE